MKLFRPTKRVKQDCSCEEAEDYDEYMKNRASKLKQPRYGNGLGILGTESRDGRQQSGGRDNDSRMVHSSALDINGGCSLSVSGELSQENAGSFSENNVPSQEKVQSYSKSVETGSGSAQDENAKESNSVAADYQSEPGLVNGDASGDSVELKTQDIRQQQVFGEDPMDGQQVVREDPMDGQQVVGEDPMDRQQVIGEDPMDGQQVIGEDPMEGQQVVGEDPMEGQQVVGEDPMDVQSSMVEAVECVDGEGVMCGGSEPMEPLGSDVVKCVASKAAGCVDGEAVECVPGEAVERVPGEAVERVPGEAVERVTDETMECLVSEALEHVAEESVERVVGDAVECVTGDVVERVTDEAVEHVTDEAVERVTDEAVECVAGDAVEHVTGDAVDCVTDEAMEHVPSDAMEHVDVDAVERVADDAVAGVAVGRVVGEAVERVHVDVEGVVEGEGDNVQAMLSSLVYSLGLGEMEAKEAISLWQNRTIITPLDSGHLSLYLAKRQQLYEEEEAHYQKMLERSELASTAQVTKHRTAPPESSEFRVPIFLSYTVHVHLTLYKHPVILLHCT